MEMSDVVSCPNPNCVDGQRAALARVAQLRMALSWALGRVPPMDRNNTYRDAENLLLMPTDELVWCGGRGTINPQLVNGGHPPDDQGLNEAVSRLLCSEPGEYVLIRLRAYCRSIEGSLPGTATTGDEQ